MFIRVDGLVGKWHADDFSTYPVVDVYGDFCLINTNSIRSISWETLNLSKHGHHEGTKITFNNGEFVFSVDSFESIQKVLLDLTILNDMQKKELADGILGK